MDGCTTPANRWGMCVKDGGVARYSEEECDKQDCESWRNRGVKLCHLKYQRRDAGDDKASIYFHFRVFSKSGTDKSMERRHVASLTHP